jgi:hypothetical protein
MITTLPAWVTFDPLPVLDSFEDRAADRAKQDEPEDEWEAILA